MIKCEVVENFTLEKFSKLKNVKKVMKRKDNEFGVGDTFECDEKMADYLTGNNILSKTVVKVTEVEPEKVEIVFDNVNANQPIGELKPEVKRAIEYINEEIQPKAEFKKTNKKKKSSKK